ncbi:MAG: hypothetical protein LBE91_20335 [Tannerella sp.]|nr:hypothetical protein [Tannerella sp.]
MFFISPDTFIYMSEPVFKMSDHVLYMSDYARNVSGGIAGRLGRSRGRLSRDTPCVFWSPGHGERGSSTCQEISGTGWEIFGTG